MLSMFRSRFILIIALGATAAAILGTFLYLGLSSSQNRERLPDLSLLPAEDRIFDETRNATPNLFGTPIQALAALDESEIKLAIKYSAGDMDVAAASALLWSMTPDDVRTQPDRFIEIIDKAEQLISTIDSHLQTDQPALGNQQKQAVALLGVCGYVVVTESTDYDAEMPRIKSLAQSVLACKNSSKNMVQQAVYLLFELNSRSWLDPEGQSELVDIITREPNFQRYLPQWRKNTHEDFLSKSSH